MNKLNIANVGLLVALAGAVMVGTQLSLWFLLVIDTVDSIFGIWPSVCSVIAGSVSMIFGGMVAWNRTNAPNKEREVGDDRL